MKLDGEWAQGQVDEIRRLLPEETPQHLLEPGAARQGNEFDIMRVFSVLRHIWPPPGEIIDYVYWFHGNGASPLLYLRGQEDSAFSSSQEIFELHQLIVSGDDVYDNLYSDGTPEAFFELVLFRIMGRKFYLYWHDNYETATVLCSPRGIEGIFLKESDFFVPPLKLKEHALALNPCPIIRDANGSVFAHVLVFTPWGGFIRDSFRITKDYPHRFRHRRYSVVLPYECGIVF
jgi:hypothetical protein